MTCSICGNKTRVIGSQPDLDAVYRRRKCVACNAIFYTVESETTDTKDIEFYNKLFIMNRKDKNR